MAWLRICSTLLLLAGCSSQLTKFHTEDLLAKPVMEKAVIVAYRDSVKPNQLAVENFLAGQSLGELHNKQFSWRYVEPGEYVIKTRWPDAALIPTTERTVKVEAGQYYLIEMRGGVGISVLFKSREFKHSTTSLKTGDYSQALKWLDDCCALVGESDSVSDRRPGAILRDKKDSPTP